MFAETVSEFVSLLQKYLHVETTELHSFVANLCEIHSNKQLNKLFKN